MMIQAPYSIRFDEETKKRPFADWTDRGRPKYASFMYSWCNTRTSNWIEDQILRILYVPAQRSLSLDFTSEDSSFFFTALVDVREESKEVHVTGMTCKMTCKWMSEEEDGSFDVFYRWLDSGLEHDLDIEESDLDAYSATIGYAILCMFGADWELCMPDWNTDSPVPREVHDTANIVWRLFGVSHQDDLFRDFYWRDGTAKAHWRSRRWFNTIGTYNVPPLDKTAAAIRIQSAWRGWRVRMTIRLNPHNRLGRHVILRDVFSMFTDHPPSE